MSGERRASYSKIEVRSPHTPPAKRSSIPTRNLNDTRYPKITAQEEQEIIAALEDRKSLVAKFLSSVDIKAVTAVSSLTLAQRYFHVKREALKDPSARKILTKIQSLKNLQKFAVLSEDEGEDPNCVILPPTVAEPRETRFLEEVQNTSEIEIEDLALIEDVSIAGTEEQQVVQEEVQASIVMQDRRQMSDIAEEDEPLEECEYSQRDPTDVSILPVETIDLMNDTQQDSDILAKFKAAIGRNSVQMSRLPVIENSEMERTNNILQSYLSMKQDMFGKTTPGRQTVPQIEIHDLPKEVRQRTEQNYPQPSICNRYNVGDIHMPTPVHHNYDAHRRHTANERDRAIHRDSIRQRSLTYQRDNARHREQVVQREKAYAPRQTAPPMDYVYHRNDVCQINKSSTPLPLPRTSMRAPPACVNDPFAECGLGPRTTRRRNDLLSESFGTSMSSIHISHTSNTGSSMASISFSKFESEKAMIEEIIHKICALESEKKQRKARSATEHDVSAIRKKQRALLVQFEKGRDQIKKKQSERMAIGTPDLEERAGGAGRRRGHKHRHRREVSEVAEAKSKNYVDPALLTASLANNQITLKVFEQETGMKIEELLKRRQSDLASRRRKAEELMKWHQQIVEEETYVTKLESILINGTLRYLTSDQLRNLQRAKHAIDEVSIQIPNSGNYTQEFIPEPTPAACSRVATNIVSGVVSPMKSPEPLNNTSMNTSEDTLDAICGRYGIQFNRQPMKNFDEAFKHTSKILGRDLNKVWTEVSGDRTERFNPNDEYALHETDLKELYTEALDYRKHLKAGTPTEAQRSGFWAFFSRFFSRKSAAPPIVVGDEREIVMRFEEPRSVTNQMPNDPPGAKKTTAKTFAVKKTPKSTVKIPSHKTPNYGKTAAKTVAGKSDTKSSGKKDAKGSGSAKCAAKGTSGKKTGAKPAGPPPKSAEELKAEKAAEEAAQRLEQERIEKKIERLYVDNVPTDAILKQLLYQEYSNKDYTDAPNIYHTILRKQIRIELHRNHLNFFDFNMPEMLAPPLSESSYTKVMTPVFAMAQRMRETQQLTSDVVENSIAEHDMVDRTYKKALKQRQAEDDRLWRHAAVTSPPPISSMPEMVEVVFNNVFGDGANPIEILPMDSMYIRMMAQQMKTYALHEAKMGQKAEEARIKLTLFAEQLFKEMQIVKQHVDDEQLSTIPDDINIFRAEFRVEGLRHIHEARQNFSIAAEEPGGVIQELFEAEQAVFQCQIEEQTPEKEIVDLAQYEDEDERIQVTLVDIMELAQLNDYQITKQLYYINKLIQERTNKIFLKVQMLTIRFKLLGQIEKHYRREVFTKISEIEEQVLEANSKVEGINREGVFNYIAFEARLDIIADGLKDILDVLFKSPILVKRARMKIESQLRQVKLDAERLRQQALSGGGEQVTDAQGMPMDGENTGEKLDRLNQVLSAIKERLVEIQHEQTDTRQLYKNKLIEIEEDLTRFIAPATQKLTLEELNDVIFGPQSAIDLQLNQAAKTVARIREQVRVEVLTEEQAVAITEDLSAVSLVLEELNFVLEPEEACRASPTEEIVECPMDVEGNPLIERKYLEGSIPNREKIEALVGLFSVPVVNVQFYDFVDQNNPYEVGIVDMIVEKKDEVFENLGEFGLENFESETDMLMAVRNILVPLVIEEANRMKTERDNLKEQARSYAINLERDLADKARDPLGQNFRDYAMDWVANVMTSTVQSPNGQTRDMRQAEQHAVEAVGNAIREVLDHEGVVVDRADSFAQEAVDRAINEALEMSNYIVNEDQIQESAANLVESIIEEAYEESINITLLGGDKYPDESNHITMLGGDNYDSEDDGCNWDNIKNSEQKIIAYYTEHIINRMVSQVVSEIQSVYDRKVAAEEMRRLDGDDDEEEEDTEDCFPSVGKEL